MKIATFTHDGRRRIGVVEGAEIVDASASGAAPSDMIALLAGGTAALDALRKAAAGAPRLALADVHLDAPVPEPRKFLAIGLNYAGHVAETGRDAPQFPVFFNKQTSCVAGPYDAIHRPRVSNALDYEGELAFVIGKRCRHVPKACARDVIAGYLICHDVSVRDWQFKAQTMTLGKSFDTHGPIGPWLTTPDEVGDPHDLELSTFVNGERRQHARTSQLIHDCFDQVALLSTVCTLEPGDVISTGTPEGVAGAMKPPKWLVPGDVVRIEISGLGHLENRVVQEPDDTTIY
ncbi:fumarylacetoacetate hydrolase family protein [Candidatus Binatia bacterium]|nr:fumarylacetoacetate hydrolase family protein [Candidatus Binatia bacterium]